MRSIEHQLPADTPQAQAAGADRRAQRSARTCTASLCSFRCRSTSTRDTVIEAIDPAKDVDGFHPVNVGRLATGANALAPCTPTGCLIAGKVRALRPRGPGGGGGRPLQHRRQADGAAAAGRELYRHDSPTRAPATWPASCAAPTWSWRPWAGAE